jgi:dihydroorotase
MRRKGPIEVGADADLTVFDPKTIADEATFEDPMRASEGIHYVLVNGVVVVNDGAVAKSVMPGHPI